MLELAPSYQLNLRHVSRLVFDTVTNYQELNSNHTDRANQKYIRLLAKSLANAKLNKTRLQGSYLDLYYPILNSQKFRDVAIKVTDPLGWMVRHSAEQRLKNLAQESELRTIFADTTYIYLSHLPPDTTYEQLSNQEKMFLYFALEHRRFEKYYAPYVLPSVFISFILKEESTGKEQFTLNDERGAYFIETLSKTNKLSADKREIYLHTGQLIFAMIQNFENLGQSVFELDPDLLSLSQRYQIADLANKIESVYHTTGYFPDESMSNRSNNLCFNSANQLVLVDTNHLDHAEHVMGASISYVKLLRKLAQGEKAEYR